MSARPGPRTTPQDPNLVSPRRLVAGNWKMNGVAASLEEARRLSEALREAPATCRVALFPPAPLLHRMAELVAGGPIEIGAQDCHAETAGAYTGDTSAPMLHDAGATLVILGHSERRCGYRETDELIAAKVMAAIHAGLEPVVCVGESLEERRAGHALDVVRGQIDASLPDALDGRRFALAYEPVWAIGTGLTPSLAEIEAAHRAIAQALADRFPGSPPPPVLYGGSVKAANAAEILGAEAVGGALVGGASLTAADFLPIVRAAG